jgi:hypothetical protein
VPAEGPAREAGASTGTLEVGAEVALGTEVGGKTTAVAVGTGVEAGIQAVNRIAASKIHIKRFMWFSYSWKELYLLRFEGLKLMVNGEW